MILVDSSVWVDHLRRGERRLADALNRSLVACHPMVLGELACGNLRNRREVLDLVARLPRLPIATDEETLGLIEGETLMGRGIGWIDAHLVASTLLADDARLWTRDRRLGAVAADLGVAYD